MLGRSPSIPWIAIQPTITSISAGPPWLKKIAQACESEIARSMRIVLRTYSSLAAS